MGWVPGNISRFQAKLVEAGGLGKERGLVGEVGKRRSTPQGQGVIQHAHRDVWIHREGLLCISHERVEPDGV
jgi:hypothetical protein